MAIHGMILAGGLGKRMGGIVPKVCHLYRERPMIHWILDTLNQVTDKPAIVVTGTATRDKVLPVLSGYDFKEAVQSAPLGTGHAVLSAYYLLHSCDVEDDVVILPGDAPLISADSISKMIKLHKSNNCDLTLMVAEIDNPFGYGRIIVEDNEVMGIVEEKDATAKEKSIKLVNGAVYVFKVKSLLPRLKMISNKNVAGEYYFTDIIKIFKEDSLKVMPYIVENPNEITNVNTKAELDKINN